MSSTFGRVFRVTTWGESHGPAIGAVVDGVPAGLPLAEADIQKDLDRRRPAELYATPRREDDIVQILSGVYRGLTLGSPIMLLVPNKQMRSGDYAGWENLYRPSHGDYTWEVKYGVRDPRGGGRCSARETVGRVAAGAVARKLLRVLAGVEIIAWVEQIGRVRAAELNSWEITPELVESNPWRCPDSSVHEAIERELRDAAASGDSLGGTVGLSLRSVPAGWGEPIFEKLSALLAQAMMSVPAVKGVEIGAGFRASSQRGSEHNDAFACRGGKIRTLTNNSGGIQGGLSNGEEIYLRVAFKPAPTIAQTQRTVSRGGEEVNYAFEGRHDVCFVPRAAPIAEAMAALVLADCCLLNRTCRC